MGGGAARGWAHIGVLRVLEEAGIAVGAVAGTSMGAIVAAALAAGCLDAVEAQARAIRGRTIPSYLDPAFGTSALLGGRRVLRELVRHLGDRRIEDLALPTALIAADLTTGEEVRLIVGPVVPAVQASIAIPGLFSPVTIDGHRLIDGGMVANVPIAAARALGPGMPVIAIDLFADYAGHATTAKRRHALATGRSAFLMLMAAQGRLAARADRADVVVAPAVGPISTGAFHRASDLIAIGAAATRAALPHIRAVLAA